MKHSEKTTGICAPRIDFEIDENKIVRGVKFLGGCAGNTSAISALAEGRSAEELVKLLKGIQCRNGTSCPDQLAKSLIKVLAN